MCYLLIFLQPQYACTQHDKESNRHYHLYHRLDTVLLSYIHILCYIPVLSLILYGGYLNYWGRHGQYLKK